MNKGIVDKIKALLRLSRSANRHEAELALQRAFELANKHGIDTASLEIDQAAEQMAHAEFKCGERVSFLRDRVLQLLQTYFRVTVVVGAPKGAFVGRETDVAIAGYVYDFLVSTGGARLREFTAAEKKARRVVSALKRKNFVQGFAYGVSRQLDAARKQAPLTDSQSAIVVADAALRKAYMDRLWQTEDRQRAEAPKRNQTALTAGFVEGQKTKINKPLNGGQQETLALC